MSKPRFEFYKTSDLYLSAYLRTAGCNQVRTERSGDGRVFFIFENTEMMPQLKEDFYNNRAKVNALEYANNIRSQKSILHSDAS